MPVTETTVLEIACDNPACPGNSLDPADRTGWTFIHSEVYGEQGQQNVYCCADCAGTIADALTADEEPSEAVTPSRAKKSARK